VKFYVRFQCGGRTRTRTLDPLIKSQPSPIEMKALFPKTRE
jgi:hypothetical protein